MKKWLALVIILVLGTLLLYVAIPANIVVKKSAPVTVTQEGLMRFLSSAEGWKKAWPGPVEVNDGNISASYQGFHFELKKILYNSVEFSLPRNADTLECLLFVLPYQMDSLNLQWTVVIRTGINPYKRAAQYFYAKRLEAALTGLLDSLSDLLSKDKTIYGLDIRKEKVPFQHFLATRTTYDHDPSVAEIYQLIAGAREFVAKSGAKETDHPILNVKTDDSVHFETQIAIPIDKDIPGNETFAHKWMMKGGNILSADVEGGPETLKKANQQMLQYITDHRRSMIAAPFQMLITDRAKEADSTKWKTRLYYPVV